MWFSPENNLNSNKNSPHLKMHTFEPNISFETKKILVIRNVSVNLINAKKKQYSFLFLFTACITNAIKESTFRISRRNIFREMKTWKLDSTVVDMTALWKIFYSQLFVPSPVTVISESLLSSSLNKM